ncbi:MAG: hypothetical protein Q9169_007204 [Polycauliona sp. 2 TL-2023]
MSSEHAKITRDQKRELDVEETPGLTAQPTLKRPKLEHQEQKNPLSSFWDNLSKIILSPGALAEFDRRTLWPKTPVPPDLTTVEEVDLTRIPRFVEQGKLNLDDLRSYSESKEAKIHGEEPSNQTMAPKSNHISARDPSFKQHLIDHGCFPKNHGGNAIAPKPINWDDINDRLSKPRDDLSPSMSLAKGLQDFIDAHEKAATEATTMSSVFPIITGKQQIEYQEGVLYNNLEVLTDGSLVQAKPDFYDGNLPETLNLDIRKHLGERIVPSTDDSRPCLPNFFAEVKGYDGKPKVNEHQVWYDGVLGARGIHDLRAWTGKGPLNDGKAYVIAATFEDATGVLVLYTIHPVPSKNPKHIALLSNPKRFFQYHMTELGGWRLINDEASYRKGLTAIRNARDWAQKQRNDLIKAANEKIPLEESSSGSADELGSDGAAG